MHSHRRPAAAPGRPAGAGGAHPRSGATAGPGPGRPARAAPPPAGGGGGGPGGGGGGGGGGGAPPRHVARAVAGTINATTSTALRMPFALRGTFQDTRVGSGSVGPCRRSVGGWPLV